MTNTKRSTTKLTKREVEYLISLIDKEMAKFEEEVEEVDEMGDTDSRDSMKEAKKMLKMLDRIRLAVIDLDK
jgi:hypothetical protein